MMTTAALRGLRPLDGEELIDPGSDRARDETGLTPVYDEQALAVAHEEIFGGIDAEDDTTETPLTQAGDIARFGSALPFPRDSLVGLGAGGTPLLRCPTVTDSWDVTVYLKHEGQNPTGGLADREMAIAVTAAREHGVNEVVLPSTGNGGQAAAATAARAGLDCHVFVPSRSTFDTKAMINVHGGTLDVVGGRYPDAVDAFESRSQPDATSLAPFETPYRHEGVKTIAYELAPSVPDAVVAPASHGTLLVGLARGFDELLTTGVIETRPRLYAIQAAGCAPIVEAWRDDDPVRAVEQPDTICGSLEVPDPAGGQYALQALSQSAGGAIAVSDDALLDSALELARAGIPVSATGGAVVAGAERLADRGAFDGDDEIVLIDPDTANRDSDRLRSRLMVEGI